MLVVTESEGVGGAVGAGTPEVGGMGAAGAAGASGEVGMVGTPGADGAAGALGAFGADGSLGAVGAAGAAGTIGAAMTKPTKLCIKIDTVARLININLNFGCLSIYFYIPRYDLQR